jgi:fluoride exporter
LVAAPDAQPLYPERPSATLAANLIGGSIIGLAVAFFASLSALAREWRLFVIMGLCDGLTTFLTFESEIVTLLQQGRSVGACGGAMLHLGELSIDEFCRDRNARVRR